jgi:diaminohydroxyphosphoribosylaminopyrimidine deaminase/5-amino-6-(5-phosphoribosylamino)uracil reductase
MIKDLDVYYIKKALELARKGEGYTSPNPLVGAIVVKDGEIIGKGYHQYYGGPHAEVYALDEAGEQAKGATIYVTLEPCSHYGKTPPCSLKIIKSGIKRVVVAMEDPNPLVAGRGIDELKKAGIEVETGILEKEARLLNEAFLKYITSEYPFVYLKTAQTLDGYLATRTGDSQWITNKKARLWGHRLRHRVDAILVGIGTILKDDPALTTRLPGRKGKDSIRIVLDARLETPLDARILNQTSDTSTIIVTGDQIAEGRLAMYSNLEQVEILSLPLNKEGRIPLRELLKKLHVRGISSLLVEGGGRVNYSFLKEGLVDKLYCFIAPVILGGNDGISTFSGKGPDRIVEISKLKEVEYQLLDDNLLLIGKF